ncbi:MAG: hypothetical protein RXR06_10925 [Thermoproteus sp.]
MLDEELRKTAVAFCTTGSVYVIWGSATGTVFVLSSGVEDDLYDEYTVNEA